MWHEMATKPDAASEPVPAGTVRVTLDFFYDKQIGRTFAGTGWRVGENESAQILGGDWAEADQLAGTIR